MMKKNPRRMFQAKFLVGLCLLFFTQLLRAQVPTGFEEKELPLNSGSLIIQLGEGQIRKSVVSLPPLLFFGNPAIAPQYQVVGAELFQILQSDIERSTLFELMSQNAFLERPLVNSLLPKESDPTGFDFEKWSAADFLVRGGFTLTKTEMTLEMRVYSVSQRKQILGQKYKGELGLVRRLAHQFVNDFVKQVSGKEGMFLSKLVVSTDRAGGPHREIFVMDWDGNDARQVTFHKSISFSPAWSPDGKKIAYTTYAQRKQSKTRNPDLFIYELDTKKRWLISYRTGMNSGAAFLPDGKSLLATLSDKGTPDIYRLSLDGEILAQITSGPSGAMNVEPAVSPDGKSLAFSSDRSGNPKLYVGELKPKTDAKRIDASREDKYNATPAWSPDGKTLAYAGWVDDHFDIYTIQVDGKSPAKRLTQAKKTNGRAANNEDPVFSPDGRLILYTSNRTGKSQIFMTDLQGKKEWQITNDQFNYFRPKWSKNLD